MCSEHVQQIFMETAVAEIYIIIITVYLFIRNEFSQQFIYTLKFLFCVVLILFCHI